jgi:hypothetical protein
MRDIPQDTTHHLQPFLSFPHHLLDATGPKGPPAAQDPDAFQHACLAGTVGTQQHVDPGNRNHGQGLDIAKTPDIKTGENHPGG